MTVALAARSLRKRFGRRTVIDGLELAVEKRCDGVELDNMEAYSERSGSLEPRGRETWSLIPSFAHRRMAAGLPISLLRTPEYEALADRADRIFATEDPAEAVAIWHELNIDYLYVGRAEREAFPAGIAKFAGHPERFGRVFSNDEVAVYVLY